MPYNSYVCQQLLYDALSIICYWWIWIEIIGRYDPRRPNSNVYAMAVLPLLLMLLEIVTEVPDNTAKMIAYADDFTAADTIKKF